jgi:hypothetical protein
MGRPVVKQSQPLKTGRVFDKQYYILEKAYTNPFLGPIIHF